MPIGTHVRDGRARPSVLVAMIELVDFNTIYSAKEKAGAEVKKTRRSRRGAGAKSDAAPTEGAETGKE